MATGTQSLPPGMTRAQYNAAKDAGLSDQQIQDMFGSGGMEYLNEIGYSVGDFIKTGLQKPTDLRNLALTQQTLDRMKGATWTQEDRTRFQNRQTYGPGMTGHVYQLLDQEAQAWEMQKQRYNDVLTGLTEREKETLSMFDTRSDQTRKDIMTAYKANLGQSLSDLVSSGMYNPAATVSATKGNAEDLTAALAREADQRINDRIGLYLQTTGDLYNWMGQPVDQSGLGLVSPLLSYITNKNQLNYQKDLTAPPTKSWTDALSSFYNPGSIISTGNSLAMSYLGSLLGVSYSPSSGFSNQQSQNSGGGAGGGFLGPVSAALGAGL